MSSLVTADGTTIAYTDHGGDGPPTLLVHGITESSAQWDPIVTRLADRRVVTMDLRGHGESGTAERYDLEAMAGDVVAVMAELDILGATHLVGHSLGGVVVSAVGAAAPVASVVNVDQPLALDGFKAQLGPIEAMLKDPDQFHGAIDAVFSGMVGDMLSPAERDRVNGLRRADQSVVLGVWELIFTMSEAELGEVVAAALAGYAGVDVPYLSLHGIDPGDGYGEWLAGYISGCQFEVWPDHGHYPQLVDPERFVARLREFW